MSADLLTVIPRQGTLRIAGNEGLECNYEGWWHLDDGYVMRRGLGDLRSWSFCKLSEVVEFRPDKIQS